MPLSKPLSALLTTILVAIPTAITTLVLNKPKPPREIDAVITLDENTEVIPEEELKPTDPPPPPPAPVPQPSSQGSRSSGSSQQGLDGDGTVEQDGGSDHETGSPSVTPAPEPEVPPETPQEPEENEDEEKTEEKDDEKEDKQDDPSEQPEQAGDKDMTEAELQESLIEVIKKIIEEGKGFNTETNGIYKLYIVNSSLESFQSLVKALQDKKKEAKAEQENYHKELLSRHH